MSRIVVTGLGVVSPYGLGLDPLWEGLRAKRPALLPLEDPESRFCAQAGLIRGLDPKALLGPKGLRTVDRLGVLALIAAQAALTDSRLALADTDLDSVGVVLGTAFGGLSSITGFFRERLSEGVRFVTASNFGNIVMNAAASQVSLRHGLAAANTTVSSGFAAGVDAIALGAELLQEGRADIVLAGGADELSPATLAVLAGLGLLGAEGFVPGEAAVWLVLEREAAALARGATLYACLEGHASAFDPGALRGQAPDSRVAERAMRGALSAARADESEVDWVLASANGEAARDAAEAQAIARVFSTHAPTQLELKPLLGECLGAGGALAAAVAVLALSRAEPRRVLVNACGYSGHQASLVLARADAAQDRS